MYIYTHERTYRSCCLWALLLFYSYKYVQFPFAPLTVIITAVWKSLPDNSDVRVITEWIMFLSGNILKILSCLFVSWGVVDSSALRLLGCGGWESVIFFPKTRKVCLKAPRNGLSLNCKFCLVWCRWLARSLHFPLCAAHQGSRRCWGRNRVGAQNSQLVRRTRTPRHGSLLSAAARPGSPHGVLQQGLWRHR